MTVVCNGLGPKSGQFPQRLEDGGESLEINAWQALPVLQARIGRLRGVLHLEELGEPVREVVAVRVVERQPQQQRIQRISRVPRCVRAAVGPMLLRLVKYRAGKRIKINITGQQ